MSDNVLAGLFLIYSISQLLFTHRAVLESRNNAQFIRGFKDFNVFALLTIILIFGGGILFSFLCIFIKQFLLWKPFE